jgi:hypothetical protein
MHWHVRKRHCRTPAALVKRQLRNRLPKQPKQRVPPTSKGTNIASASTPSPSDQKVDNMLKGTMETEDKEVVVDPSNTDKMLRISDNLDPKKEFTLITFL